MTTYLMLKLQGPMQAWGTHTFEDFRPTQPFPSLSGVAGLLGACLGIRRHQRDSLINLADSVAITVRADRDPDAGRRSMTITDFHTVMDARKVGGGVNPYPVVSRREYICDASFTVALEQRSSSVYSLSTIADAVKSPVFTPFLGRRSCPLARPLFERWCEAEDVVSAMRQVSPGAGVIYGVPPETGESSRLLRDLPLSGRRQFGTREVSVLVTRRDADVPQ